jgi:ribA/ribD-fused uncharacterized protein
LIVFWSKSPRYAEFSNFAPFPIVLDRVRWRSVEHHYQAAKFNDPTIVEQIRAMKEPSRTKKFADTRAALVRPDWDVVKVDTMERAVRCKFATHSRLRSLLLETGDEPLGEGVAGDMFWGMGRDGAGQNRLGLLLMRIRAELQQTP